MNKKTNKIFLVLLIIPVVYTAALTMFGYIYGTKETVIPNLAFQKTVRGDFPIDFSVPFTHDKNIVLFYDHPKPYYKELIGGETTHTVITSKRWEYKDVARLVEHSNMPNQEKLSYLKTLLAYARLGEFEKVNDFVQWDLLCILGIIIFITVLLKKKGYTTLILWWWYSIWALISCLGFYAYWWRVDFSKNYSLISQFLRATATHHYSSAGLYEFHLWMILVIVPCFFLIRWTWYFLMTKMPDLFSHIEDRLKFKQVKTVNNDRT